MDTLLNEINNNYNLEIKDWQRLTRKSFLVHCESSSCYFIKRTLPNAMEKYQFLANQGVSNVLYPIINKQREFVTNSENDFFYVSDYVENFRSVDEIQVKNMYESLNILHHNTEYKRQLSPATARPKFEELTKQLDYKFRIIEEYIRSLEMKPLGPFSMPILGNYHYVLDAKNFLIGIQKKIILNIKDRETINFTYLHNNPKLDHLITSRGSKYLVSIENGKLGISSLDLAKLYVENEHLNIDFQALYFGGYNGGDDFYYDYFCFLVLFIYIKRIKVGPNDSISAQSFVDAANSITRFKEAFLDKKQAVKEEDNANN